ncbi:MAG: sugar ABC transporter permease [Caldilineaceae bacterium]
MSVTSTAQSTATSPTIPATRRHTLRKVRESLFWYLLLSPSLVVIFGFSIVPMVWSMYYSLTRGGILSKHNFVGFQNYVKAATHPIFIKTLQNTTLYALLTIPLVILLSLLVALIILQLPRMQGFFRSTVYFPLIIPVVIAANIWAYIVSRDFGPLNLFLSWFGLPRIDWLGDPFWAIPAVVSMEIWRGFGFYVIILFAALQSVPKDLYEAARIDGAHTMRLIWSITIPLLRPALGFCFIMATIFNFQLFDPIYVLTKGGPAWSTSTVSWYVYQTAFESDNVGFASTMGVVLLLVILVLSLIQLRFFRSDIEY